MPEPQACVVSGSTIKPPEVLHNGSPDRLRHDDTIALGVIRLSQPWTVAEVPLPQAGSPIAKPWGWCPSGHRITIQRCQARTVTQTLETTFLVPCS